MKRKSFLLPLSIVTVFCAVLIYLSTPPEFESVGGVALAILLLTNIGSIVFCLCKSHIYTATKTTVCEELAARHAERQSD